MSFVSLLTKVSTRTVLSVFFILYGFTFLSLILVHTFCSSTTCGVLRQEEAAPIEIEMLISSIPRWSRATCFSAQSHSHSQQLTCFCSSFRPYKLSSIGKYEHERTGTFRTEDLDKTVRHKRPTLKVLAIVAILKLELPAFVSSASCVLVSVGDYRSRSIQSYKTWHYLVSL